MRTHTGTLTPPPCFLPRGTFTQGHGRHPPYQGTHPASAAGLCTHGRRGGSLGVGRSSKREQGGVIQPSAGELTVPTLCLFLLRSEARVCRAG